MNTEGAHHYIEKGIESWLDHKNYFEAIDFFPVPWNLNPITLMPIY
ncbi:hypothetical protein [Methanobacterium formicicum]|uniref:Uncharacterized protein n=1 Tax=Methanobacterium formicicum (strain DSM 3637 / PP1) TaxID=1204725 RepID=K2R2Y4_METFP|nr:hypothetical protein [Methanobacterium formicicum]EKF85597.1 hypothetical protein A994_07691 [Methanobacterium formicicum DSM 3637]